MREMLRAGARGFLLKDAIEQGSVDGACRAVALGEGYISPAVIGIRAQRLSPAMSPIRLTC